MVVLSQERIQRNDYIQSLYDEDPNDYEPQPYQAPLAPALTTL